ncbi:hypothetical protein SAMN05880501_10876 [Ureibacillus xyleni]|uniref:Uncharacterized protein n=1 Tax=Ureibacillus xyleni TaxID=614648 RepID=A0A285T2S3_9BACL|nr:hypothetical protein [Ureibacillus xyleni]SOC15348.1 hypothetical protein SAMN05880501_10876 [Ureibacillus xyleni]
MKSVNMQLDENNWLEITQVNGELFEVRVSQNGIVNVFYLTQEELKATEYHLTMMDN